MLLVGIGPRKVPVWAWTVGGAVVLLAFRLEPMQSAARSIAEQWNVLLFIFGLMTISAAAEHSGLIAWIASALLERAGGSRKRLFVYIFLAGAFLTMVMANDTTAIVFTPIVYRAVGGRGINALPFLYACTFVADTASFGLPFSNPANILVLQHPRILEYAVHLFVPMLVALAVNLGVFLRLFRSYLRDRYAFSDVPKMTATARHTLIAMLIVAAGYVAATIVNVPIGPVAVLGSLLVVAAARLSPLGAARQIGWGTFLLLAGMFVLLDAVVHEGAVSVALQGLHDAARAGTLGTLLAAAFGSAFAANLFNNLPVAAISSAVVARAHSPSLAYPLIAGIDLGPNLSTTGSLATILWLSVVRSRGFTVSPLEYLRLGLCIVPQALIFTCLWLWIVR